MLYFEAILNGFFKISILMFFASIYGNIIYFCTFDLVSDEPIFIGSSLNSLMAFFIDYH